MHGSMEVCMEVCSKDCSPPKCALECRKEPDCGWFLHLESMHGSMQRCYFFKNGKYGPRIIDNTNSRKLANWYTDAYVKQKLDRKSQKKVKSRNTGSKSLNFAEYEAQCAAKRPVYDSRQPCIDKCGLGVKIDDKGLQIK